MIRVFVVAALAAACSSPQRPKSADACANVGGNMTRVLRADKRGAELGEELIDKISTTITERCRADAWTAEATACLGRAESDGALGTCVEETLTKDQSEQLMRAMVELMPAPETSDRSFDSEEGGSGTKAIDDPCGGDADGVTHDPCGGGE